MLAQPAIRTPALEAPLESRDPRRERSTEGPQVAPEELGDALLAERARGGDRAAFGRLYERHARYVHGLLLARVHGREATDLVQEVFLVALRSITTLGDPQRFAAWVGSIARNLAHDALRRRGVREVELDGDLPEPAAGDVPPEDARACADLIALVRGLPEAYRETLVLRLVEGLSGPEIASLTGLTHGSVRVNLHRGMRLLRERLAAEGWA